MTRGSRATRGPDRPSSPPTRRNEFFQPAWTGDPDAPRPRHRLARESRPRRPASPRPTSGTGRPGGCSRPAERSDAACRLGDARLLPVDVVLLGYLAVVTVVAMHRRGRAAGLLVGRARRTRCRRAHLPCSTRPGLGPRRAHAARDLSAAAVWWASTAQLDVLNRWRRPRSTTTLVQRWELALFGGAGEPRLVAGRRRARSGPRCCTRAYFSYYLDRVGAGVLLPLPRRLASRPALRAAR